MPVNLAITTVGNLERERSSMEELAEVLTRVHELEHLDLELMRKRAEQSMRYTPIPEEDKTDDELPPLTEVPTRHQYHYRPRDPKFAIGDIVTAGYAPGEVIDRGRNYSTNVYRLIYRETPLNPFCHQEDAYEPNLTLAENDIPLTWSVTLE